MTSRFSLANVIGGRRNTISETDARPSVLSSTNLNSKLKEENELPGNSAIKSKQHLFFGPYHTVFESSNQARVLHGERRIQKTTKKFWLASQPISSEVNTTTTQTTRSPSNDSDGKSSPTVTSPLARTGSSITGGVTSTISAAGRYFGQKVVAMKFPSNHVNLDSFCDGCGMDPILGDMFSCSICENYSLCQSCYESGVHGYEDSAVLKSCREDYALLRVMETSKNKVPEKVFTLLMQNVCRGQVDKFNFLARWICSVVLGHPLSELSVRGIEIPTLDHDTRATLVTLLSPVLAERTDLEVCMEWFSPNAENEDLPSSKRKIETLRIWVATDKDTKSPFTAGNDRDENDRVPMSPSRSAGSIGSPCGSPTSTPPPSPKAMTKPNVDQLENQIDSTHMSSESNDDDLDQVGDSTNGISKLSMTNSDVSDDIEDNMVSDSDNNDSKRTSTHSDIQTEKVADVSPLGLQSEGIAM